MGTADRFALSGKVALVTGGSRMLGREMVLAFAEAGADVVIASRKQDACDDLAAEVTAATGRRALPVACHVGHWSELDALVELTYAEMGHVDVLVNNAGMSPLYPSLPEVSEELFDKVIGVNFKGPFRLTALVAPRMAAGDGGSIINISSVAAIRPTPTELPYAAAKSALDVLTVGFAQAYGPSVRVNTIMAGPFLTDLQGVGPRRVQRDGDALSARSRRFAARDRRCRAVPRQRGIELHHRDGGARRRRPGRR